MARTGLLLLVEMGVITDLVRAQARAKRLGPRQRPALTVLVVAEVFFLVVAVLQVVVRLVERVRNGMLLMAAGAAAAAARAHHISVVMAAYTAAAAAARGIPSRALVPPATVRRASLLLQTSQLFPG